MKCSAILLTAALPAIFAVPVNTRSPANAVAAADPLSLVNGLIDGLGLGPIVDGAFTALGALGAKNKRQTPAATPAPAPAPPAPAAAAPAAAKSGNGNLIATLISGLNTIAGPDVTKEILGAVGTVSQIPGVGALIGKLAGNKRGVLGPDVGNVVTEVEKELGQATGETELQLENVMNAIA